ncbi:MAG: GntR family transcriptional regulator [Actinomycetota bacterium]|nr:GntR family transcriptional regulator [Actinomycetota bacterium]
MSDGSPAYRRVGDVLVARILSGELASGARVPSERELASEQGISRMTARAAVDLLARRGLVERRERSGVFVARPKIEQSLDTVAGLSDQLESRGVAPGAEVLEARTVEAGTLGDTEVVARLGLSEGDRVHVIVRVRTGDGEPLVLEENYLPEHLLPGLLGEDLAAGLYALIRERYGLSPARSRQELEPSLLDPGAAAALGSSPDALALRVTRTVWDSEGRPLEFARDHHRGDRMIFVSETLENARTEGVTRG